jgi:hypothetical protein
VRRSRASPRSVKQNLDPEPYGILATTVRQFAAKMTCNVWPLQSLDGMSILETLGWERTFI